MDTIGKVAGSLITRSHLQKRDEKTALIGPITDGANLPALFIRHVDRDIADVVAWSWKGTGEHGPHSPTLRRALNENELAAIDSRMMDLRRAVEPYTDDERRMLAERLNDMFKGFPSLRSLDKSQSVAMIVGYLRNVKNFPPWAIAAACDKVKQNRAGLNAAFTPTEGEFFGIVDELVAPYRERMAKLRELLDAPVDPPQAFPTMTREQVSEKLGRDIPPGGSIVPPSTADRMAPREKFRKRKAKESR